MSATKGFDRAAKDYDKLFTYSVIGKAQRNKVHKLLRKSIKQKIDYTLEINCGTGEDVKILSSFSDHIVITDQSPEMIALAKQKNEISNSSFEVLDINEIAKKEFKKDLDCVFSNFGGLNCIGPDKMEVFFKQISKKMKVGGKLILVIMPRKCIWERLFFYLKNDKTKANRRLRKTPTIATINGTEIPTWYYSPKEILSLAGSNFKTKIIKPVGLFIPPSYLEKTRLTNTMIFSIIMFFENIFNSRVFANNADHFYIELELINR